MPKNSPEKTAETLITFPCDFTLKVIGKDSPEFEKIVMDVLRKKFRSLRNCTIQKRFSKDKNYLSYSITVHVKTKRKLDGLYRALSQTKEVVMVL